MMRRWQRCGGSASLPVEGLGAQRMKRFGAAASIVFALGSVSLAGCEALPWHFDPLGVDTLNPFNAV